MRVLDLSLAGTPAEPLWQLCYRYWFWGWLFRDASQGDLLRRAAAWRHNLSQRMHLPVYMRRWLALLALTFAVAMAIEISLDARAVAAVFYVGSVLSAVVQFVAGVAWVLRPCAARASQRPRSEGATTDAGAVRGSGIKPTLTKNLSPASSSSPAVKVTELPTIARSHRLAWLVFAKRVDSSKPPGPIGAGVGSTRYPGLSIVNVML